MWTGDINGHCWIPCLTVRLGSHLRGYSFIRNVNASETFSPTVLPRQTCAIYHPPNYNIVLFIFLVITHFKSTTQCLRMIKFRKHVSDTSVSIISSGCLQNNLVTVCTRVMCLRLQFNGYGNVWFRVPSGPGETHKILVLNKIHWSQ